MNTHISKEHDNVALGLVGPVGSLLGHPTPCWAALGGGSGCLGESGASTNARMQLKEQP